MGGGVPRGGRPNQTAYYVAMVSILFLLLLLCCYFCYFFVKKVVELSKQESPTTTPSTARQRPPAYPVQPVIRDSATAMAMLCKQLPPPGKGDTIFPTSTSPAALQTDTGEALPAIPALSTDGPQVGTVETDVREKLAPPVAAPVTINVEAAR